MARLAWTLWLGCLIGCGWADQEEPDLEQTLAQYAAAVGNALDRSVSATTMPPLLYPKTRQLQLGLPEHKIDWLQFAQLHVCDLGDLVGQRNSGLGRVALASQRLVYEITFIERLVACRHELPEWLTELLQEKRAAVSLLWWNALFAGPEFRQAMASLASVAQSDTVDDTVLPQLTHLRMASDSTVEATLEPLLQRIRSAGFGQRVNNWQQISVVVGKVADALANRHPAVCLSGSPTPRSRRLVAVFQRHFVPLQNRLARNQRVDMRWLDDLDQLAATFDAKPSAYVSWRQQISDVRVELTQSLVRHQQAWQNLLTQCGLPVQALVPEQEAA